jgi:hypothetical protein
LPRFISRAGAAGEVPAAGDPIAARYRDPAAVVGGTPGEGRPQPAQLPPVSARNLQAG